jgi:hypothetical protein
VVIFSFISTEALRLRRSTSVWPPAAQPGAGVLQEMNNSADVQQNRVNISNFICKVVSGGAGA